MGKLNTLILDGVHGRQPNLENLSIILEALLMYQDRDLAGKTNKIHRPCRTVEEGVVELRNGIAAPKNKRKISVLSPERIENQSLASLMHEQLANGDTQARKAWHKAMISRTVAGDIRIKIVGDKVALQATLMG